ncbi:DUF6098 family protein [Arthrobacter sp. B1805]|uniref:DUF6098 family protein n=1 Tax=Arthrobacter sp. B1805 TaxID=2058892 RepID=UPI000CE48451|nr:DUF6098 family protein [Arthrobacter sp. B1805]
METASRHDIIGADDRVIGSLEELAALVQGAETVYLRYSCGYEADRDSASEDGESGLALPGLSVNPLTPEQWWTRPIEDWLARQICQYRHLAEDEERYPWVLTGSCVGRGPDCEPLLAEVKPLGQLHDGLLQEAERVYDERFDTGNRP